ncbi:protein kinase [bacterium]|nr:protein kinase [bacterium]
MIGPVPLTDKHRQEIEEFRVRHRTGVLTLVFTDMVESTRAKQDLGDAAGTRMIRLQQDTIRRVLERFRDSQEISTAGDSFFIVFLRPSDAVRFALQVHAALREVSRETPRPIFVRIGIHMGEVFIQEKQEAGAMDVLGIQVDTASRVMSLASGGQTLLTRSVFDNSRTVLRGEEFVGLGEISWLEHGAYRFKGVDHPFGICEVGETTHAPLAPPTDSEKAHRVVSADQEPVLGWRPAIDQEIPTAPGWTLVEKLGEGGFGEVWKARHKTMKEVRVFKFCFRADRVRSLKREVTLFRLLRQQIGEHPNIVRLYDVFFDEPPYYIVMEAVEGRDLGQFWEDARVRERLPIQTRLEIVAQVADALQAAHDAGIIHRDIKPSNILVSSRNNIDVQVKLTDFGIGQVVSSELLEGKTAMGFTQTFMGTEMSSRSGTHLYMAPELVAGQPASTRSDIYSLGVVLYQIAIGDLSRGLAPDWRKDVHDRLLADIMAPCFAGNPAERYASVSELAKKLRNLEQIRADLAESQRQAEAAFARRRTLRFLSVAATVFLASALLLFWGFYREQMQRRVADASRARAESLINFMLFDLRDKLKEVGRLDLLEGTARQSMEYYAQLPDNPKDRVAGSKRAAAFLNIGDVFLHQGRPADALSAYDMARGVLARQVETDPKDHIAKGNLFWVHYRIAQAHMFADRPTEGFASFEAAIALVEEMLVARPDDATLEQNLVSVLTYYSESLSGEGRFADAERIIQRALTLADKHRHDQPANSVWARSLVFIHRQLGMLAFDRGRLSAALEYFRKAEDGSTRLIAARPDNTELIHDLVSTKSRIADVLSLQGKAADALAEQADAHTLAARLASQDPLNVVWKNSLLATTRLRGSLLLTRWNIDEASQSFSLAQSIAGELLRHATDNATFLSEAAGLRLRNARVLTARNRLPEALEECRRGRQVLSELVARNPASLTLAGKEAGAALDMVDILIRMGDLAAAQSEVEHALARLAAVREKLPENAFLRNEEASALRLRGEIARRRSEYDSALADYEKARAIAEELVGLDGSNVLFANQRARVDVLAARTQLSAGRREGGTRRLSPRARHIRPLAEALRRSPRAGHLVAGALLMDQTRRGRRPS